MRHRPTERLSPSAWDLLSGYIDGELTAEERLQVEHWLQADRAYQQAYRQLLRLRSGFIGLQDPTRTADTISSQAMTASVMEQLDRSPLTKFVSPRLARRCAQVAAGVVLLLSGGVLWQLNQSPQPILSLEEPPVDIPAASLKPTLTPELVSIRKARSYLLTPDNSPNDAYSILLTDG